LVKKHEGKKTYPVKAVETPQTTGNPKTSARGAFTGRTGGVEPKQTKHVQIKGDE